MTTLLAGTKRARVATGVSTLTAADRCDRCNAQAYVRITLPAGELLFCGHHGRAHAAAYRQVALEVQDESERLRTVFGRK